MRRSNQILALALPVVAVALVALGYRGVSDQPSSTVDPEQRGAESENLSTAAELGKSAGTTSPRLTDDYRRTPKTPDSEAVSNATRASEDAVRKREIERATRTVRTVYPLLIEKLGLTLEEEESLISLLIELGTAGIRTDEHERANRIAAIIGDSKLQDFLALERNLSAYGEIQNIRYMMQQNGVPLADPQRDQLLEILLEGLNQYEATPPASIKRDSIEALEYRVSQRSEYERRVMELAPSVLSPEQITYLFEQYQFLSYQRASAVEAYKERAARGEDTPALAYPAWYPGWLDDPEWARD